MLLYRGNMTGDVVLREDWYLLKVLLAASKKAITEMAQDRVTVTEGWLEIVTEMYDMEVLTHRMRAQEEQCCGSGRNG